MSVFYSPSLSGYASDDTELAGSAYRSPIVVGTSRPLGWLRYLLMSGRFGAASGAGPASLTVEWEIPDGATPEAQTVYFDTVSRMGTGEDYAFSVAVGDGVSTSKLVTGLLAATTYYFAVTITDGGVESEYGPETSGTTP